MGLFGPSPFAHPVPSFPGPVQPPTTDPDVGLLATIRVSCEWLPYIRGALMQLGLQSTWKGTPDEIYLAQARSNLLISLFLGQNPCDCNEPCPQQQGVDCGCDGGCDVCCLRFNNGILQTLQCGVWVDVPGQSGFGAQPGAPAIQPAPGGGIAAYPGCLSPNGNWYVPTVVSSGDQISINNMGGSWNDPDADPLIWRGPQGEQFALGAYIAGATELIGTDPLNSAPHMTLLALINGVYYDLASSGTITVPPGLTNVPVELLANDSNRANDSGQVCFDIQVVNNQLAPWSHTFDFTVSPYSADWHAFHNTGFTPADIGQWSNGVGWDSVASNNGVNYFRSVNLESTVHATITRITVYLAWAGGTQSGPTQTTFGLAVNGVTEVSLSYPTDPSPVQVWTAPSPVAATDILVVLEAGGDTFPIDPGGAATITKIIIEGLGTDPY